MYEVSVPAQEQSMLRIGSGVNITHIDGNEFHHGGVNIVYVPAGTHEITYEVDSYHSSTAYGSPTTRVNFGRTSTVGLLPLHTYRVSAPFQYTQRGDNDYVLTSLIFEDVTESLAARDAWIEPLPVSPRAPKEGQVSNFGIPPAAYFTPLFEGGMNLYHGNLKEGNGYTGVSLIDYGFFIRLGAEFGFNRFGLGLSADGFACFGFPNVIDYGGTLMAQLTIREIMSLGIGYGLYNGLHLGNADKYLPEPYIRGEIMIYPGVTGSIAVYGDYFYQRSGYGIGIRWGFVGETIKRNARDSYDSTVPKTVKHAMF